MQKRWTLLPEADQALVTQLNEELNMPPVLAQLLVQRGITSFDEARRFFLPDESLFHPPFLMKDMDRAVSRIRQAIADGEKILIYGDYDVDGTTAVTLVYSYLKKFHPHIAYYIPDRYKEGYGISFAGIDYAEANGYTLMIALDCGIKSVDKAKYAGEKGIDMIIGDHHLPGDELPDAVAVLDPKRSDCPYPYKELSGCGIGFKLCEAFAEDQGFPAEEVYALLDLCAISIASDIVPITGENRAMAALGLKKLNADPSVGLKALMEVSGKTEGYTISDVVFMLGPRINAAGRMGDAKHAVKLLLAEEKLSADEQGALINLKNAERKEYDKQITAQALAQIDGNEMLMKSKTTVVFQPDWHKGVIGIVASRLTEKYYRPTIVLTQSNGHVAGSARSVAGFDLYEALCGCSDLLIQFGGHKFAAGLTMEPENVPAFQQKFEEVVSASISDELLIQQIKIDGEISLCDIDARFFRILCRFAPFGPGNMSPVFLSRNVQVAGIPQLLKEAHLKFFAGEKGSAMFECIAFGMGEQFALLQSGKPLDICYCIEEKVWKENRTLQLMIKGIRPAEEAA
ncbi:MAG: single-stranded-DNA-specific exonuclease RecJ [Mucilaginibacter polytrichastri]|nr:single-stranded-DNA-specific exonuclease RecJ [Mucilaginibacter polytrichastri]